jgi:hypothetical protein
MPILSTILLYYFLALHCCNNIARPSVQLRLRKCNVSIVAKLPICDIPIRLHMTCQRAIRYHSVGRQEPLIFVHLEFQDQFAQSFESGGDVLGIALQCSNFLYRFSGRSDLLRCRHAKKPACASSTFSEWQSPTTDNCAFSRAFRGVPTRFVVAQRSLCQNLPSAFRPVHTYSLLAY